MPRQPLRVVSTKIPMGLYRLLRDDAKKQDLTPSRLVHNILAAHYQWTPAKPKKAPKPA